MLFQQINVQTKAAYIEQKSFKVTATNVIKNQTNVMKAEFSVIFGSNLFVILLLYANSDRIF